MFANLLASVWAKVIGAVLIAALAFGGYKLVQNHFVDNANKTVQIDGQKKVEAVQKEADAVESDLASKNSKDRIEYENNRQVVGNTYARDLAGVQQRASRSSGKDSTKSTRNSEGKTGATGAELSREDAEFLTEFARDTEELKIGLIQCYKEYGNAKDSINNFLDDF